MKKGKLVEQLQELVNKLDSQKGNGYHDYALGYNQAVEDIKKILQDIIKKLKS